MSNTDAIEIPLIKATNETLKGYGYLIDSFENSDIEIVTWPKQGWREIDKGTGNEGGSTEGSFDTWWEGSTLWGQNNAVQHNNSDYEVDGKYVLGHAVPPGNEPLSEYQTPEHIYIWHVNYHPDGGQLFYPSEKKPFISPLALPGDNIQVGDFKAFYFDGSHGLYIHPNIWHEGVFPIEEKSSFHGKQGKVHARVSIDLQKEFKKYIYFKTTF